MTMQTSTGEVTPKNPSLKGCDYAPGAVRSSEWNVWARRGYYAEFTVFDRTPGAHKPALEGSGEGATISRALFEAAAKCIDLGADRLSVISGLSVALLGESKLSPPPPLVRRRRGMDKSPGTRTPRSKTPDGRASARTGQSSKLKGSRQ